MEIMHRVFGMTYSAGHTLMAADRPTAMKLPLLFALAAGYGYGGRTTVDGVKRDTIQRNWRLALMVAYPIRANQGISISIGSGGNFGAGTDFDTIAIGYQYAWGGR